MKRIITTLVILIATVMLTACGSSQIATNPADENGTHQTDGNATDSTNNDNNNTSDSDHDNNTNKPAIATAKLGNLAEANVTIYKVEDNGTLTALYSEVTSGGDSLESIGKFNTHSNELDDDTFYLYKVVGGRDWDSDDDGNMDENATINHGTIRAIAKGSDIKDAGEDFIVSYVTELVYEKIASTLKYHFDKESFQASLQKVTQGVINDVNGDGEVDINDMLTFDPQMDEQKLSYFYKRQIDMIKKSIHSGKIPMLNLSYTLGVLKQRQGNGIDVALSRDGSKAYVADWNGGLLIVDVRDPMHPQKLSSFDTDGYSYGVVLSSDETKAYVADDNKGLIIIDINDSTHPKKLGSFDIGGYASDVALSNDGTKAYVVGSKGFIIVDVNDSAHPQKLGSCYTNSWFTDVVLSKG